MNPASIQYEDPTAQWVLHQVIQSSEPIIHLISIVWLASSIQALARSIWKVSFRLACIWTLLGDSL